MKTLCCIPLILLTACSSAPKLVLQPQPPAANDNSSLRYPELVRPYYVGRYADPNDGSVMHEQHVLYRVEENTRWDLHPGKTGNGGLLGPSLHDAAFSPLPVNEAELAEINAQRLATAQIMGQARTLSGALAEFQTALQQVRTNLQETAVLRGSIIELKKRLDALETVERQPPPPPNPPADPPSLSP